jgi:hypothetical protein
MKCRLLGIIWIALLILGISSDHAFSESSQVSIDKIVSAKQSYDGREVTVSGKVSNLKLRTSKAGSDYTTFTLSRPDGKGSLHVYSRGHANVKQDQTVKVTGIYRKEKRVGKYTFHNEIEAAEIKRE